MEEQTVADTKAIQLIDTTKNSKKQTENDNNNNNNNNNNENNDQPNTIDVKITCCSHVGWDGVLLMLFMLVVSGLLMYITYEYTSYFNFFDRDLVWLFIAMSALFLMVIIYYIIFWRKLVKKFTKEEEQNNTEVDTASCFEKSQTIYNEFQVFGKYYLWVLYASEISESIFQLNNVLVVYTCSLPVGFSSIICIILSIDCFHTVMFMIRDNDAARRDRQIIIDTIIDFFCVAVPILIMRFGYNVPIPIDEMCYL